jgi:hypothetical protein
MSFTPFSGLPAELRLQIWDAASGGHEPRTIEVRFESTPYYQKATSRKNTLRPCTKGSVQYRYVCHSADNLGVLGANAESRAVALHHNPNALRLNEEQIIRFNAARDTIHFDLESYYNL